MINKFLLSLILIVLSISLLQQIAPFVEEKPLYGSFTKAAKPRFKIDSLLTGSYQRNYSKWIHENIGFRSTLIRLHHQIGYWLYSKSYANAVIVGKNNYLLDKKYIYAHTGQDFIGEDSIKYMLQKTKQLQDSLSKYNIKLFIVLAPGKASFYNEYVPDFYLKNIGKTNYQYFSSYLKEFNINHIDFKKWFFALKKTTSYPLFPKNGIHWSTYGALLAADSIIRYTEQLHKLSLPHISFDNIRISDSLNEVDQDVGLGMNLLYGPKNIPMAYPTLSYNKNNEDRKLHVLSVADSYNWTLPISGMSEKVFKQFDFLYYNKQLYPNSCEPSKDITTVNKLKLLSSVNTIMIMMTDANLSEYSWNFIEDAYSALFKNRTLSGTAIPLDVAIKMYDIKNDPPWIKLIKEKAIAKNISIDSMLYLDAKYIIEQSYRTKNGIQ